MPRISGLDGSAVLKAIRELRSHYQGFPWESEIWKREGQRRSPYRVLILFGLSARTKDRLLVAVCRLFFGRFPDPSTLLNDWPAYTTTEDNMVRNGQIPFIESMVDVLRRNCGAVPRDRESLLKIRGVGEKIAECVTGYGWGQEALPVDGNAIRVVERLRGPCLKEGSLTAAKTRELLKESFEDHRNWMNSEGVAMIDLHELLRLHGQVICSRRPRCSDCPVSACPSRREPYSGSDDSAVSGRLWQEWRDLLLEPASQAEHLPSSRSSHG